MNDRQWTVLMKWSLNSLVLSILFLNNLAVEIKLLWLSMPILIQSIYYLLPFFLVFVGKNLSVDENDQNALTRQPL